MNWLIHQIENFNILQFISILFFVVTFQKSNTTKLLDKQTSEIHESIKEVKDCIHWSVKKDGN
jgi:diacylglycerol kinase